MHHLHAELLLPQDARTPLRCVSLQSLCHTALLLIIDNAHALALWVFISALLLSSINSQFFYVLSQTLCCVSNNKLCTYLQFLIPLNIDKIVLFQKSFPLRYRFCVQDGSFLQGTHVLRGPTLVHSCPTPQLLMEAPFGAGFFSDLSSSCRVSGQWSCGNYLAME